MQTEEEAPLDTSTAAKLLLCEMYEIQLERIEFLLDRIQLEKDRLERIWIAISKV